MRTFVGILAILLIAFFALTAAILAAAPYIAIGIMVVSALAIGIACSDEDEEKPPK